jgi:transcriptional regulator with XRE-family HTH domain
MTFTERLRALRELKGMNQKDFAELLDVQPSAYNKWEKGVNRPDYENLNRIAKLLNSTTDYLLGLDDQPSRPDSDMYALTGLCLNDVLRLKKIKGWLNQSIASYKELEANYTDALDG